MKKSLSNKIFVLVFIGLISTPLVLMLLSDPRTVSTSEKRDLNAWMSWQQSESLVDYFSGITDYVQDHFGFRETLISLNTKILFALNQSPAEKVIKGKDGWLFYKTYDPMLVLSVDRPSILSAIERRARHVSYRATRMAEQGIAYTYVIAPNKMVMYANRMPRVYALGDNNRTYALFQESLEQPDVPFYFDLQALFKVQQKNNTEFDLYFKNDTHWNHYGAYLAYNAIAEFTQKHHPKLELSPAEYSFTATEKVGGDLAKFIGLNDSLAALEPRTQFSRCAKYRNFKKVLNGILKGQCDTNETTALLIGDSFRTNLYPFITQSVGTLYVATQGISHKQLDKLIEEIKPDIVIEQMVQRNIGKKLPY